MGNEPELDVRLRDPLYHLVYQALKPHVTALNSTALAETREIIVDGVRALQQNQQAEDKQTFKSGAQSSERKPPYHLVPFLKFMPRLAARYQEGVDKGYGEDNYLNGALDRDFVLDRCNHTMEHLARAIQNYRRGQFSPEDDDTAAALWGVIMLMIAEEAEKEQLRAHGRAMLSMFAKPGETL